MDQGVHLPHASTLFSHSSSALPNPACARSLSCFNSSSWRSVSKARWSGKTVRLMSFCSRSVSFEENEGQTGHCEFVIGKQLGRECKEVIVVFVESTLRNQPFDLCDHLLSSGWNTVSSTIRFFFPFSPVTVTMADLFLF